MAKKTVHDFCESMGTPKLKLSIIATIVIRTVIDQMIARKLYAEDSPLTRSFLEDLRDELNRLNKTPEFRTDLIHVFALCQAFLYEWEFAFDTMATGNVQTESYSVVAEAEFTIAMKFIERQIRQAPV
jgi:hypothetical protein